MRIFVAAALFAAAAVAVERLATQFLPPALITIDYPAEGSMQRRNQRTAKADAARGNRAELEAKCRDLDPDQESFDGVSRDGDDHRLIGK
jgi:hypothetical protein